MKVSDVNAFKGQFKDAALNWAGSLVDQMLPNKVAARTLVKNAIGNMMARLDGKINQWYDIHTCRHGGIGRHKGLKIPRSKIRTGSIPVAGTKPI